MNMTLKTLVAGMLLGSTALAPMAFAQSTAPATPSAPAMDAPAATAPATGSGAATTAPVTPMANDSAAVAPAYMTEQSETQVSANTYIGQSVYNAADESIGNITDLIFERDGGVVAAIVGVGGFLGIGEKDVAVPFEKITVTREADGDDIKLTTMETAETLTGAPEYKTIADQRAETGTGTGTVMPTDNSTTSSTVKP